VELALPVPARSREQCGELFERRLLGFQIHCDARAQSVPQRLQAQQHRRWEARVRSRHWRGHREQTRCEREHRAIISNAMWVAYAVGLVPVEQQHARRLGEHAAVAVVAHKHAGPDDHQLIGGRVLFRTATRIRMTAAVVGDVDERAGEQRLGLRARGSHAPAIYRARERRRNRRDSDETSARMRR
jgi:hypothetical protein